MHVTHNMALCTFNTVLCLFGGCLGNLFCIPHPNKYHIEVNSESSKPSSHQTHTHHHYHLSPPLILLAAINWMYKIHACSKKHRICCCSSSVKASLHSETFICTNVVIIISKSLVKHSCGFKNSLVTARLDRVNRYRIRFLSIIKDHIIFLGMACWAMATICHRPKKGQHPSRGVAVNIHYASLKQDQGKKKNTQHMLISVCVLSHNQTNALQRKPKCLNTMKHNKTQSNPNRTIKISLAVHIKNHIKNFERPT